MREFLQGISPSRRIGAALVLAATGLATGWWLYQQRAQPPEAERARRPDGYFRGLEVVRYGPDGRPETKVLAAYAEHYEDEPWIHLHDLTARGLAEDGPAWQLTSRRGRMTDDGVELETWGDVVLSRSGGNGTPVHMETDRLFLNTEEEIATTDSVVLITQGASRIRGRAMQASLKDEYLRLEHDVEAFYEK